MTSPALHVLRRGAEGLSAHLQPSGELHDPVFAEPTQYGTAYYAYVNAALASLTEGPERARYADAARRGLTATLDHLLDPDSPTPTTRYYPAVGSPGTDNLRDFMWPCGAPRAAAAARGRRPGPRPGGRANTAGRRARRLQQAPARELGVGVDVRRVAAHRRRPVTVRPGPDGRVAGTVPHRGDRPRSGLLPRTGAAQLLRPLHPGPSPLPAGRRIRGRPPQGPRTAAGHRAAPQPRRPALQRFARGRPPQYRPGVDARRPVLVLPPGGGPRQGRRPGPGRAADAAAVRSLHAMADCFRPAA